MESSRMGFVAGARAALDNVVPHIPAPLLREMEAWLEELEVWTDGPMPPPPMNWPDAKVP